MHTGPLASSEIDDESAKHRLQTSNGLQRDAVQRPPSRNGCRRIFPHIKAVFKEHAKPVRKLALRLKAEHPMMVW
eukprot:CAMPEP_0172791306 /NCGR_PEP_ID=MMETSP1074-20121228/208402_1 /TAXON_ID=2916 /ORGANISM="Ceratium fusus, Strain PA161109" /LENGTH=74 /DNA_ID=CAMNT_0013628363 /DNA_START=491 /DNA_END=712 /DNA_ORIENTATION=-